MKLNIISFDIEVLTTQDRFPSAERDPIIMITFAANYGLISKNNVEKKKVVLLLDRKENKSFEDRDDHWLLRHPDEKEMIKAWEKLVKNADIITTFNGNGFDIPYIINRARTLRMKGLKIGNADKTLWKSDRISKGLKVNTINNIQGKIVFDVLYMLRRSDESNVFKKEYNLKSLKLQHVSKEIFGEEKGKLEFSMSDMTKYWNTGEREEDFIKYGLRDSEVVLNMVTQYRLLDKFIMLSRKSGKLMQDVIDSQGFGSLVENLLIKKYKDDNRVAYCRTSREDDYTSISTNYNKESNDIEGAFVLEPKLGITDYLASADFRSLYPSLIIKNNMCFSTVISDKSISRKDVNIIESPEEIPYGRFVKPHIKKGIIPLILEELMIERAYLKKEMKKYDKGTPEYITYDAGQIAAKILLNSFYGYTGDKNSRMYSWAVASSVTGSGRKQILSVISTVNKSTYQFNETTYKTKVAIGDTDSAYIQVIGKPLNREIVITCVNDIINKINSTLEAPMELVFENYIERLIVTAKKRYTMLTVDDKGRKSITSKGIEVVRRDWCDYATEAMDKVVEILLKEKNVSIATKKIKYMIQIQADTLKESKGIVENLISINLIEKLILSKKLSKILTLYDAKAIHWTVAKKMMQRGKQVEVGDRVSYLILNNGKKLISDKAEDADYVIQGKSEFKIDTDYYIYSQLLPPIMRVLEAIGFKETSTLVVDKKQKTMMDY